MKIKIAVFCIMAVFVGFCGYLVWDSGVTRHHQGDSAGVLSLAAQAETPEQQEDEVTSEMKAVDTGRWDFSKIRAVNSNEQTVVLGELYDTIEKSDDPDRFKFQIELTTKGAAIRTAKLTEFDDRAADNPVNLSLLEPVEISNNHILSLSNTLFKIYDSGLLPLNKLDWSAGEVTTDPEGTQSVSFETILKDEKRQDAVKLIKTYRVSPGTYQLDCTLHLENLTDVDLQAAMAIQGPIGIEREAFRSDMRSLVAAYSKEGGVIESTKRDANKIRSKKKKNDSDALKLELKNNGGQFLWAANTNKYFAAILRPVPENGKDYPEQVSPGRSEYYDPDSLDTKPNDNEQISFALNYNHLDIPANQSKQVNLQVYLGPKDRDIFQKNELYKKLQYFQTIHFLGCCCPQSIINPLAFTIMGFMKWLYHFIPNYGIVIMILVALVRLLLHPLMIKQQTSMMKMQKLGPQIEQVKKKYAGNNAEMNKRVMAIYKEQGASPVMSFIPMFLQLPILIALYSAIFASIELRGASFLPFWITDLSLPDALISFKTALEVPFLGWKIESFNLLPVFLGGAMIAQQKLMPSSSMQAQTNPQMAQQQKMMMFMMPIMMLFIFYKMPSGLNLYFMSSTAAGVVEQIVIRKHIREKEERESQGLVATTSKLGGKAKKKKPKPFYKNTM